VIAEKKTNPKTATKIKTVTHHGPPEPLPLEPPPPL
jgi:hypothetical protein